MTAEELQQSLLEKEAQRRGRAAPGSTSATADRFLRSVQIGSQSVWGTNAERQACRREAFGYQARFGQPALFVTLTPNTDNSIVMAVYANGVSAETMFEKDPAKMPSPVEIKRIVISDGMASARLFERIIEVFIDVVLGFDRTKKRPKRSGGLFGFVKAYYGMTETQGRGTLHAHFLVWLHGAPRNSAEFNAAAQADPCYQESILRFTDSIVTTDLPPSDSALPCLACGEVTPLRERLPAPRSAFRDPRRVRLGVRREKAPQVKEPALLRATCCGVETSSQHLLRQLVQTAAKDFERSVQLCISDQDEQEQLNAFQDTCMRIENDYFHRNEICRWIQLMPPSSSEAQLSAPAKDFLVTSLVSALNMHWWAHTGSCFKKSRAQRAPDMCRYNFPHDLVPSTRYDNHGRIVLARKQGHEYINGYNAVMMSTFKCNHDIQVLIGGEDATDKIYYICKYVTKDQKNVDCTTAVALASFHRRQYKEQLELDHPDCTSLILSRRRVSSMIYTMTNKQEIAAPLASLYILRGSACYKSHSCDTLPLHQVIRQLCDAEDHSCTLVEDTQESGTYTAVTILDDYMYRPSAFEDLSLYEFKMKCFRRPKTPEQPTSTDFKTGHKLIDSHNLRLHKLPSVPVISGPRLPKITEASTAEEIELHGQVALTLFKSFRKLTDLLGSQVGVNKWSFAYDSWASLRSKFVITVMNNMYDYHIGRKRAQDSEDDQTVTPSDRSDDGHSEHSEDDAYNSDDVRRDTERGWDSDASSNFASEDEESSSELDDDLTDLSDKHPLRYPSCATFDGATMDTVNSFQTHRLAEPSAQWVASTYKTKCSRSTTESTLDSVYYHQDLPTEQTLRRWVDDNTTDNGTALSFDQAIQAHATTRRTTVIEIFDDAMQPSQLAWTSPQSFTSTSQRRLPALATLQEVSQFYTLNELQHIAFITIGKALLTRWRGRHDPAILRPSALVTDLQDLSIQLQEQQLLMFLGGEGGTGKSRVIDAVNVLCSSWGKRNAIMKTAMTGKAATLIGGQTFESFKVLLKSAQSTSKIDELDLLIIDEVSMMSKSQLNQLDQLLRKRKKLPDIPFGGIHIVLAGDFLQLPPVKASPIFRDPSLQANPSPGDVQGFALWQLFKIVIVLQQSMRFLDDPEWGEGCTQARKGVWTQQFLDMINSRLLTGDPTRLTTEPGMIEAYQSLHGTVQDGTRFVVPDNYTRTAINNYFTAVADSHLPDGHHPIRVVAKFNTSVMKKLSRQDIKDIMGKPDSAFGRLAPFLDLIPGMRVQVTQNVRPLKGVANGTMGVLESVQFPPHTSFRLMQDSTTGICVYIPDKRPLFALLRIDRGTETSAMPGVCGESDLFPVFPDVEPYSKPIISLTPNRGGEKRTVQVKIQQFPFVSAVSSTFYKVQGETLESMAIVNWKTGQRRGIDKREQAYLMLSRVVKRSGLVILKPFTTELALWSRPPQHSLEEEERLVQRSAECVAEIQRDINIHGSSSS